MLNSVYGTQFLGIYGTAFRVDGLSTRSSWHYRFLRGWSVRTPQTRCGCVRLSASEVVSFLSETSNLHGMPVVVPELPAEQYVLPEALGRLYDCTVLSSDSLRPLADAWCKFATGNLLRVGNAVRPLRAAVDVQLLASAVVLQQQNDDDSRSGSSGPDDGSD